MGGAICFRSLALFGGLAVQLSTYGLVGVICRERMNRQGAEERQEAEMCSADSRRALREWAEQSAFVVWRSSAAWRFNCLQSGLPGVRLRIVGREGAQLRCVVERCGQV